MPRVAFKRLVGRFSDDLETYGARVFIEHLTERRPARIRVNAGEMSTDCILFLWTVTPGGPPGVRKESEYRIQATGVEYFELEPGWRTIVGGWDPSREVWAFWDVRRHTRFSKGGSSGLHIQLPVLERAGFNGIEAEDQRAREGREVVAAVRPDLLLWYVQQGETLHDAGEDAASIADLLNASPEDERAFIDSSQSEAEVNRRYDLVQTMRACRDAKFRPAVLLAYRHRCAVCEVALKLVDAAHIVPVKHPKSRDVVTNGLGLCRSHHAAYDNALIGIQSDGSVVLNDKEIERLVKINLDHGLIEFRTRLPRTIRVPASIEARPDPANLLLGLRHRRWPEHLIR